MNLTDNQISVLHMIASTLDEMTTDELVGIVDSTDRHGALRMMAVYATAVVTERDSLYRKGR